VERQVNALPNMLAAAPIGAVRADYADIKKSLTPLVAIASANRKARFLV
jgi:hypothetical protein